MVSKEENRTFTRFKTISFIIIIIFFTIFMLLLCFELFYDNEWKTQLYRNILLKENHPFIDKIYIGSIRHGEIPKKLAYKTDSNGFIMPSGPYAKADLNIFFLGGSTTACLWNPPEFRFPYVFWRLIDENCNIKVNIFNAGVNGNNSFHNINILLNKIRFLKPDYVFLMNNINDLSYLLNKESYKKCGIVELNIGNVILNYLAQKINLVAFIKDIYIKRKLGKERFRLPSENEKIILPKNLKETISKEFKKNLEIYAALSKILNFRLILLTQPYYLKNEQLTSSLTNNSFYEMTSYHNQLIIETALKYSIPYIDLAKYINSPDLFYDGLHYTDKGSNEVASYLFDYMVKNELALFCK